MARAATVAGHAIPGIIVFFLGGGGGLGHPPAGVIVHWAGGGLLDLRIGHFVLRLGFT
jgi:hypothetical protein